MIRTALPTDLPRLVMLAREEHALSPWSDLPFHDAHVEQLMASFIGTMGRTLLCSASGYLAGLVQQAGFSPRLVAMEYACFAKDGQGMHLIDAFERWAERMGATSVVMHDYIGSTTPNQQLRLMRVLQRRRGYRTLGVALVKRLE